MVVGIGASAGGLEALQRFFENMPPDGGMAFVVIQHLSPDHKSLMVELLSKHTTMRVRRVEDEMAVEPNTVYLLPPKKNVVMHGHRLKLGDRPSGHGVPLPIDIFFASLAEACGEAAVGVVLSGTGSDGMRGVREIKAAGGTLLVQDEASAKFDGMPRAAISTGLVDAVLLPEQMPAHLVQLATRFSDGSRLPLDPASEEIADDYSHVISLLRRQTGVDFTHYKPSSILRRIERRMGMNSLSRLRDYARLLSENPREVVTLYKELLIGVTRFFRDPEAFELLRTKVIPQIVESTRWDQQIRVWVPACSTGEEAYSIGTLFLEQMEAAGKRISLKIFATDIDRGAIEYASTGLYPESIAADVSGERLNRFFARRGDSYQVSRDLRALVLFAVHNLIRDPPFTRLDLVTCRNLLIYMEPVLQRRVLSLFHFSLNPGRFLLLGPSETVGDAADQFALLDSKWKLFHGIGAPRQSLGETLAFTPLGERRRGGFEPAGTDGPPADSAEDAYRWLVSEFAPTALQVTEGCELLHVFGDPSAYLTVPVGRASLNLVDMLPRPLSAAVSTAVHQAVHQQREVRYGGVRVGAGEKEQASLRVVPLPARRGERPTLLVVFEPLTAREPLPGAPAIDGAIEERITDLQEELQYTKENLQATIEELETSNEELQATNEELLSSNEELQSTNEELQSVNEELHTVNVEYQAKIQELSELNSDLDNLLRGTSIGTLFLDENLSIRRFTPAVASLVNLIPRDIGRPIEHFTFNFSAPGFVDDVRHVLGSAQAVEREVDAQDGRHFLLRILPYQAGGAPQRGVVITFVDITQAVHERQHLQYIVDSLPEQIAVLDKRGRIALVNRAWRDFAAENGNAALLGSGVGADYLDVCRRSDGEDRAFGARVVAGIQGILDGTETRFSMEYPCHAPDRQRWFVMNAAPLQEFGGVVVSHVDVTARKQVELELHQLRKG
jgi:two-component system CheB/CheR fusion protein